MGKTILITGSSSGIGKASAQYFTEQGWNVAATMRNPDVETELKESSSMRLYRLDVQNTETIKTSVLKAISDFGRVDAVLNNAGYGAVGPFEAATPEQIRRQFDVNVFGMMAVTRQLLPHFRENRSGTVMNVSSGAGRLTIPLHSLYCGRCHGCNK